MSFLARTIARLFSNTTTSTTTSSTATSAAIDHRKTVLLDNSSQLEASTPSATSTPTTDSRSQYEDLLGMSFTFVSDQFEELATFSNDETRQLGEFASLAYLDRDANLGDGSYPTLSHFATDLSSGYVRARGAQVVVTYKGTDTARDFQTDFDAWPLARPELLPEGRIHGGFLKAWESTWPQVVSILESHAHIQGLQVSDLTFTVCGHSLGAAQATLAALQVARHLVRSVDQVRLLTFGSPRVFTWAGAAYFERLGLGARTLRVAENDVDPVTMVNLGSFGFKHIGLNLRVVKPAAAWPHLMDGYMAGLLALNVSTFVPTFSLGTRRAVTRACLRLLHL